MNDPVVAQSGERAPEDRPSVYEAPRVETVLTPDEMEREVLFAGPIGSDQ